MKYEQLEHIVRAARDIINEPFVYVIGSQSVLPWLKKREGIPPKSYDPILKLSMEADIIPGSGSDRLADLIDGSLGEESMFDDTFGYYAQGVGFETPKAPKDWISRCLSMTENGKVVAYCMHPTDLFIAKSVASREKDGPFLDAMIRENLVRRDSVLHLMPKMAGVIPEHAMQHLADSIQARFNRACPGGRAEKEEASKLSNLERDFHHALIPHLNDPAWHEEGDVTGTVLALVKDANMKAFALLVLRTVVPLQPRDEVRGADLTAGVEADGKATDGKAADGKTFAVPVSDTDRDVLSPGREATFRVVSGEKYCTIVSPQIITGPGPIPDGSCRKTKNHDADLG